jgi:bifunctional DNA-binding transcriptional regulator/antitoxin component of YhaV-PrlF toxin-antitoxin module
MNYDVDMRTRISKGGQVSIPAAVRHRWATEYVSLEDRGDVIVMRPLPSDPIAAARGSLREPSGPSTDEMRAEARAEEEAAEERRASRR